MKHDTRFRKGRSGNPAGRPKSKPKRQPSAFDIVIDRKLTITQGSKVREVTPEEALQHKTYQAAIAGKRMAQRTVMKWIEEREEALAVKNARYRPSNILLFEPTDPKNAYEALCLLGIAAPDSRWHDHSGDIHLQLEPWAVQMALSRRGLGRLTDQEIVDINRCTRDSDTLVWPTRFKP
jgi:hypothetical protein